MCEKKLDEYLGMEMLQDEMRKLFVDKWVIAEITGETERFRTIGKAINFFDTEKEMHLEIRRLRAVGDRRSFSSFRGIYGANTPRPIHERVADYEEY